ncbi:MAG TPA: Gp138 family membrane-puncturing spike protein [Frateuria sp.]|uniref:Gp138 family membrane-puncturing spike protein n=1 Tax=Frateuria sp. TaxID=2211372 RepID=UPI002DE725E3|nr:Gp138 family membrane-puncturing spike protein [Frateuria sp.]
MASNPKASAEFVIRRMLGRVRTATLVKVLAVSNAGGVEPVGTMDVQPLVNQTDGEGNVTPLPVLYGLPYMRIQGGTNAVILDPQIGDIGVAVFADRDLSAVIATKAQGVPGSLRRHSLSDGLYLGGMLNGTPQQYVQFTTSGITVLSPQTVTIQAPNVKVQGNLEVTGTTQLDQAVTANSTITASGEVKGNGIALSTHKHSGVSTGGGTSGPPTA